ncbi:RidA family protein [Clostridium estertheticum]|uniref:Reactive intermediate/imine deaminase n=2 Tax=Clostridium estertheticum TaxID=238834 RepID=A0A1J0GKB6_9CLOT|nr:RidA family protein [Clostridium estertheticum]APC41326.1 reactive intermediate/imine deaminase [Clostridium estertheticum subsp. estertheticum]MBU3072998.1 RidA family protein [Clostridium estertheticum]MBU3162965.1 RidA family protein [Clostridium estertheticum]MBU3172808.1 RidA family protein [Clostridium estertheticum]MBW9169838.1 RidA family protein [Clostridium estertheticum]
MEKNIINTNNAPAALGPYSQAVKVGNVLYTSGQLAINPVTGEFINDDIKKATAQSLDNVKAILEEAGSSLDKVVKTLVFLKDMDDFAQMNEIYSKYFTTNPPARSCIQAGKLPKDALVEIEVIAIA